MAIPGVKPKLDPVAKVRIGEKRTSERSGKEYPAALDYFVCDHPEFARVAGERPKELTIRLAYADASEAFSTGLEWWGKTKAGKPFLACYTKDGGPDPIALRMDQMLDPDDVVRGEPRGQNRLPITCRARQCPHFGSDCKPIGRLVFQIAGDPQGLVYQLDTKAFNTIELIEGELVRLGRRDLRELTFRLWVEIRKKGRDTFPVIHLEAVSVDINTEADVTEADALLTLAAAYGDGVDPGRALVDYLDATREGWRDDVRYIERVKEIGAEAAVKKLLERL